MNIITGIKELDEYPANFLKGKFYQTLPGAIFSLFMLLLQISSLIACLLYYFIQRTTITFTFKPLSSFNQSIVFPEEQTTINISIFEYNTTESKGIKKVMEYYRMTAIRYIDNAVTINIFPNILNSNNTLNDSIPYSKLLFSDYQNNINFPRVSFVSCTLLNNFLVYEPFITIEGKEELVGCKEITDDFYLNENIYNKIFIYSFQMRESFMTTEHTIKTTNEFTPIDFQFKKIFHPAYDSKQKTIAVLFDNKFFFYQ